MSNNKIVNLFEEDGHDEIYQRIKNEERPWYMPAKQYWNSLYEKYHRYLDSNFATTLRDNFFERMWELTQISFIASQLKGEDKLIDHRSRKRKCPDFCMEINGKRYYYETTAPGPGNVIELNEKWEDIQGKARATPVTQYKERLCSAVKEKAYNQYYDGKTSGYQSHMIPDSGLIIAISTAGIPWYHQPDDMVVDASCFLGLSPRKIDITLDKSGRRTMGEIYHDHDPTFQKTNSTSLIKTDYFCDDNYSHISAVLISNTGWVFFADVDKYGEPIFWKKCRNDYLLIHNPLAKVPLPLNYISVEKEISPVAHCKETIS